MTKIDFAGNAPVSVRPASELRAILYRRKWQIIVTFLLIVGAVTTVTLTTPKQFETHMKILVKNERPDLVVSTGATSQPAPQGEVGETAINTEIELLNSSDLIQQVVISCGLDKPVGAKFSSERHQLALENAANGLRRALKISPAKKANIIEVQYTAVDPRQAVTVLSQLAASYLESHLRVHGTPGTREFFLSQAEHYQRELGSVEAQLTEFRLKNNIVLFEQQKEDTIRRESETRAILAVADAAVREYEPKIAVIREQAAAVAPRVVTQTRKLSNQSSVERLSTMLLEIQNRRTMLLSKYRADDRLVQEVSQEMADTQAALDLARSTENSEQASDINPVRQTLDVDIAKSQSEYAGLRARREAFREQAGTYRAEMNRLGRTTTEYEGLSRAQKAAEDNYLLYSRKAEEARITESLDQQKIANVVIVEHPVQPILPSRPNVPLNLELGTLLAGIVSLGVAFSAEYLTQGSRTVEAISQPYLDAATDSRDDIETIQHTADLELLTGLPVLAVASGGHSLPSRRPNVSESSGSRRS